MSLKSEEERPWNLALEFANALADGGYDLLRLEQPAEEYLAQLEILLRDADPMSQYKEFVLARLCRTLRFGLIKLAET